HDGGFAHGDLQASNIMVSTDMKQMKIVDFDWGGPDGKVFLLATLFLGIMMLSSVPIEPNRTELLVRFGFGSSNLSSGSGPVHQTLVQVRVRFIKPWFRFGSVH